MLAEATREPAGPLELPAALTMTQRTADTKLPDVLPLSRRCRRCSPRGCGTFRPGRAGSCCLPRLRRTADLPALTLADSAALEDLAAAERAGLVSVGTDARFGLEFRHPLTRAAVVELANGKRTPRGPPRAGRTLAGPARSTCLAPGQSRHPGPMMSWPACLSRARTATLPRGDAVGAIAALTRAAELSPEAASRGRRLAEAAYNRGGRGRRDVPCVGTAADARQSDPELGGSLHAATAAAFLLLESDGDLTTAHRLLAGAIRSVGHGYDRHDHGLIEALLSLAPAQLARGAARVVGAPSMRCSAS